MCVRNVSVVYFSKHSIVPVDSIVYFFIELGGKKIFLSALKGLHCLSFLSLWQLDTSHCKPHFLL